MTMLELYNCQCYAERVLNFFIQTNHTVPKTASEAEVAVREYNKEWRSFKSLFGYSIRGYIPCIVECIGLYVETD